VQCDASSYRHTDGEIHLLIIEALQRALEKEPQVALVLNLAPQLSDGGLMVPERVSVEAWLGTLVPVTHPIDQEEIITWEGCEQSLGTILELTRNSSMAALANAVLIEIPENSSNQRLSLKTTIQVFGTSVLGERECGLTMPKELTELGELRAGTRIEFRYLMGPEPGFIYRIV
jgi:hypothetical protein